MGLASARINTVEVLSHQGGWDEILLVAAPLAMLAGLLFLANRRASRAGRRPRER